MDPTSLILEIAESVLAQGYFLGRPMPAAIAALFDQPALDQPMAAAAG